MKNMNHEALHCAFSSIFCYLSLLCPKYSQHPQSMFFPQYDRPSFTPIKHNSDIIVLYIFIFRSVAFYFQYKLYTVCWSMLKLTKINN
jgi:hypothetical protein